MELLTTFIVFNILNVIIQTVKSIATIKCGKTSAALINALAYGLYTYIIVLTNCELTLWVKCLVVALANFVGVWVVKLVEEKARKDKLWKVEANVLTEVATQVEAELTLSDISHNCQRMTKWSTFNCFCNTQAESAKVKAILEEYNAKYFVSESKVL